MADPRAARRDDRPAVLPALDDQPADAGVVRARSSRHAVRIGCSRCRTSRRCSRSSATRSCSSRGSPTRAQAWGWSAGYALFVVLCAAARAARASAQPRRGTRRRVARSRGRRRPASEPAADARAPGAVVRARRDGLGAAARGDEPHHAEHRVDPAALDRAARASTCSRSSSASTRPAGIGATSSCRWSAAALGVMAWTQADPKLTHELGSRSACSASGLFIACMFCHGELVRLKPAPRYLTRFYLMISLGGAIGAVLVGIVAPLVLPAHFELAGGLVALRAAAAVAGAPRPHRVFGVLAVVAADRRRSAAASGRCASSTTT